MAESKHPWRDAQTLRELYWGKRLNQQEVADRLGTTPRTVSVWMNKHGIETREGRDRVPWTYYRTSVLGYERWHNKSPPDKDKMVKVHRLLAVAEYGFEAVVGHHVHHKNGIPWDNRPENIELVTPSEHGRIHYEQGDRGKWGNRAGLIAQHGEDVLERTTALED